MDVMITASGAQTVLTTAEVWTLIDRLGNPTRHTVHLGGAQYLMHWPDVTVMTTNPRYRAVFGLKQGR